MKIFTAATLLSMASAVLAFETTVPCLMWSPRNYIKDVKTTDQFVINKSECCLYYHELFVWGHLFCQVDCPRKPTRGAFESLKEQNKKASSRSQLEYITNGVDVHEVAKMIASQCDTSISILDASTLTSEDLIQGNAPIVAILSLPPSKDDVNTLKGNDALLSQAIQVVEGKVNDDYAVIYTSSDAKESQKLYRRAPSTVSPKLPIFAKYQLFTPGVFMVLGVVILFMFIAGVGITWLVGIQTPVRFEAKQKKQ
ncbi:unnamed protein product [Mucor hiemalis]